MHVILDPYVVSKKLGEVNYVIDTTDRRKSTQHCHVKMLKATLSYADLSKAFDHVEIENKCSMAMSGDIKCKDNPVDGNYEFDVSPKMNNSEWIRNIDEKVQHLSVSQRNDRKQLIHEFQDIFPDSPPKTSWIKHDVDVGDVRPIKQHPYRVNPVKDAAMAKEVDYLLKHDIIEPSSSSWSSPCILVAKPDGSNRFVTDFRRVNSVTKPDSFPIPRLLDCIDKIGDAKYISVFDCLKKVKFVWTPVEQEAFEMVKLMLTCEPVLKAPDFSKPFQLAVDASAIGMGAVLMQVNDNRIDHPVSFYSKKFVKHQQNYSVVEKEALSLLSALRHYNVYLGSSPHVTIVYSDHNPLVFVQRMKTDNQRLLRWSLALQEYNVDVRHIKGCDNVVADCLSRIP